MAIRRIARRLSAIAALVALASICVHAGPLEGRWRLAEQTYESGGSNLAERAPVLHLDVAEEPGHTNVTVWSGVDARLARSWPAMVIDGLPPNIQILERSVDAAAGTLHSRYRIEPPSSEGNTVDIVEDYALSAAGDELKGTMTVELSRDGEPRGSFVLHRRFVREPR